MKVKNIGKSSMATATPLLFARKQEKDYLSGLNDRFAAYVSRVRQMRDQSNRLEASAIYAATKKLEDEIYSLKAMYERELEDLRASLDAVTNERNQFHLSSSKNASLASEYQDKLADELNTRKKVENALADAQRVIAEKESLLNDARITITQHQNAHLDTQKDRDNLHTALTDTQSMYDAEAVAHGDMKSLAAQLKDKLNFERQVHEKEMQEMKDRLAQAHHSLNLAEERLHEHNLLDENLTAMLAKVKVQSEAELRRFREESELTYQNSLQQVKNDLDNEAKSHAATMEELIHLKSVIDQLNAKIVNLESKCASTDQQNSSLIQTLEVERQQAANTIKNLEEKLRTLQDHLNEKIRELGLAYNSNAPLDLELEAFGAILEAEEKRLNLAASNFPTFLARSTTYIPHPVSPLLTRAHTTPPSVIEAKAAATKARISRPKSVPEPGNSKGSLPLLKNSVRRTNLTEATPQSMLYSSCPDPITTKLAPPQRWTYVPNYVDYHTPSTSHTGNVRILEVNPDGRYVRLFNTSAFQDEEIGSFIIQQNVGGRPVSVFRFPPRTRIKANTHITVWSASSHAKHGPPSDFLWKEQNKWGTGPDCTTILCKPNGQAIAWTTAAHPYGTPNFIATREQSDVTYEPSDGFANTGNTSMNQPEKKPFASSPRNSTHPSYTKNRAEKGGSEARTKNPQSRSQKYIADDEKPKSTRIGGNTSKYSVGGTKKQSGIIRLSPSVKKYDSTTNRLSSFDDLNRFSSQQRVTFQPPMPKPGHKIHVK